MKMLNYFKEMSYLDIELYRYRTVKEPAKKSKEELTIRERNHSEHNTREA